MNISKLVKVVIPMLLVSALVIISACAPTPAPTPTQTKWVKVGVIADLSGPASVSTVPIYQGITDYLDYVNEELGGIDGVKLEVLWGDSKSDPAIAVTHVTDYIERGVVAICGTTSVDVMGSKAALEAAGIPAIGPFASKTLLLPPSCLYAVNPEGAQQFATHLDWYYSEWKKKGLDRPMRVALIAWDHPTGITGAGGVKRWIEMQPAGVAELVYEANPGPTTVDYTPELLAAKAANPDVIPAVLFGAAFGMVMRDAGKAGLSEDVAFLMYTGCFADGPRELAGTEVDRAYAAMLQLMPHDEAYEATGIANHLAQTRRNQPDFGPIGVPYSMGVTAAVILHEAIKMALEEVGYDNLAGTAVREYGLHRMCNVDLGVGPLINYCEGSRVGPVAFRITEWNEERQREEAISGWVEPIPLNMIYPEG